MKKIYFLILLIFLNINNLLAIDSFDSKLGFLTELSTHTKYSGSNEALEIVVRDFARSLNSKFEFTSYDDLNKAMNDYKNNNINLLALGFATYLENYKTLNNFTDKFFILTEEKNLKFDSYVLIANNKFKNKSQLSNASFILRNTEPLAKTYLKSVVGKTNNITYVEDYNTILLKTYFGEYDGCVVPAYSFKILSELNPAIKTKLTVLDESPKIYSTNIILIGSQYNKENLAKLEKNIIEFKNSIKKSEVFDLLKIQDMHFIEKSELKEILEFYDKNK